MISQAEFTDKGCSLRLQRTHSLWRKSASQQTIEMQCRVIKTMTDPEQSV